jgi:ethanolamine kinase
MSVDYLNNPFACYNYEVDIDSNIKSVHDQINDLLTHMVGTSHTDAYQASVLVGGITNILYKCESTVCKQIFIVRVYGRGTENYINRTDENIVFAHFSKLGMGPIFHGRFLNGRIEGYINAENITPIIMCDIRVVSPLSRRIVELHHSQVDISRDIVLPQQFNTFHKLAQGI